MIARPLTALTRKDTVIGRRMIYEWSKNCEEAFQTLKTMLMTTTVLIPLIYQKSSFCGQMPVPADLEQY